MKKYKIAVIPGDGIGVEVVSSALEVLSHVSSNKDFEFEFTILIGVLNITSKTV